MSGTYLFAWELGGGWGHVGRIGPVADALRRRGETVVFAVQQLDRVMQIAGNERVFQAPLIRGVKRPVSPMYSMADVLHNAGADRSGNLDVLMRAWLSLLEVIEPDVLVGDYAPFAQLAGRCLKLRRASLSNGFDTPPAIEPIRPFRPASVEAAERMAEREQGVLATINDSLERGGAGRLGRLADLFNDVDHLAIANMPELDPYPEREGANYWGIWGRLRTRQAPPRWPKVSGVRLFGYLRQFTGLPALMEKLASSRCSAVVFVSGADEAFVRKHTRRRVTVVTDPVDIEAAAQRADAYIGHGLNTAAEFLLQGKPVLCLPLQAEQTLLAQHVTAQGLGVGANANKPDQLHAAVDRLLGQIDQYRHTAQTFANQYAEFDPTVQVELFADELQALATTSV